MIIDPWVRTYYAIRQRCSDKSNPTYGGRGIKAIISKDELAELWEVCEANKMDKPSIDRIDNDGDYTFRNCQYVELWENAGRRRFRDTCPKGHPLKGKNLYLNPRRNGWKNRICRTCTDESRQRWRDNNKAKIREKNRRDRELLRKL